MFLTPNELIEDFSSFLKARAKALYERSKADPKTVGDLFIPKLPTPEWTMDEIAVLLDKDKWDSADIARLSALFFFLLAGPES